MNRLHQYLSRLAQLCIGRPWQKSAESEQATRPAEPRRVGIRRLEPRRVLSVSASLTAGVLEIVIQDDGSNTSASLLSDRTGEFFVDADGDSAYDDGTSGGDAELRGLLSELTQIRVTGDAGVGAFYWVGKFGQAPLGSSGAIALAVSGVEQIDLDAAAQLQGDVHLSASQSLRIGGRLEIVGDLTAQTTEGDGSIFSANASVLIVSGNADFASQNISLGTALRDRVSFGTLTFNSAGEVRIDEQQDASPFATQIIGSNSAARLLMHSQGSIEVQADANIDIAQSLLMTARGNDSLLQLDGTITGEGSAEFLAGDLIRMGGTGAIQFGGPGHLRLEAGDITMADGSSISSREGSIELIADETDGTISISQVSTGSHSSEAIVIRAGSHIVDATADEQANIQAEFGTLRISSLSGSIGSQSDDIDINVASLVFHAPSRIHGEVNLSDAGGGLEIVDLSRAGGLSQIATQGALIISTEISLSAPASFTAGNTAAAGDNLIVRNGATVSLKSSEASTLTLNAGDHIVLDGHLVTAGSDQHSIHLNADLDHLGPGASDGDRGSITQKRFQGGPSGYQSPTGLCCRKDRSRHPCRYLISSFDAGRSHCD
jgi:hypothetical protein